MAYYSNGISQTTQGFETKAVHDVLRPMPYPYITGMQLNGDIQIQKQNLDGSISSLLFNSIDPSNNVVWVCTDIIGWWDLPNAEVPDIPRGLDDGSYDVRGRWTVRELTFQGSILPPDPAYVSSVRDQLVKMFDLVYSGGWLFVKESVVKAAYIRLEGQPEFVVKNARGRIDFSVKLRAVNPIKFDWYSSVNSNYTTWPPVYDPTDDTKVGYTIKSSTDSVNPITFDGSNNTINNQGNTPVGAIFKITGPMTAPATITNTTTGKSIKIIQSLRSNTYSTTTSGTTITDKMCQAGYATLISPNHGFFVGDKITVAGVDSIFNKTSPVTLTSVSTNSFTYANPITNVTSVSLSSGTATVTCAVAHGLSTSDKVYIMGAGNASFNGEQSVALASVGGDNKKFTFATSLSGSGTYYGGSISKQVTSTAANTTSSVATLNIADTLELDTYNTTVLYRGIPDGSRSTLDANISWIKLNPGNNILTFTQTGTSTTPVVSIKYRSGWIG
jgi:hypothetical protein